MYFDYFLKHYRLIAIDLSKQIELEKSDLRQYFFFYFERLEKNNGTTMFFITEKSEETAFNYSQSLVHVFL